MGAPEALLVNDLSGNGLGFAVQPVAGGNQFFDVGTFDNVQVFFGYCAQVSALYGFTPSQPTVVNFVF